MFSMREAGAHHLNQFNGNGKTALHIAASTGNKAFVAALVTEIFAFGDPRDVNEGLASSGLQWVACTTHRRTTQDTPHPPTPATQATHPTQPPYPLTQPSDPPSHTTHQCIHSDTPNTTGTHQRRPGARGDGNGWGGERGGGK